MTTSTLNRNDQGNNAFSPSATLTGNDLEAAWFQPEGPPSRPSRPSMRVARASTPPAPINDPLADSWFR